MMMLRSTLLTLFVVVAAAGQDGPLVSVFDKELPENKRDLLMIERAAQEVAKKAGPCTVGIILRNAMAMGSGVVISEDGYVLTAAHVAGRPGREVVVKFPDGREVKGETLGLHTTADGGLIKITDKGKWPFVPVVEQGQGPDIGDWCVAIGHPRGFQDDRSPPVRLGRVIEVTPHVIRTDCAIMGGDSGGPLFDMQGRVIGIHSRITESLTENYHVPVLAIREAWDWLVKGRLYPEPVPSEFLALLDINQDGELTRAELTSDYLRDVFDRLVKNFGIDADKELKITTVTEKVFKWREKPQPGLIPLNEEANIGNSLPSELFARGREIRQLFEASLEGAAKVTVRALADDIPVALGIVIRADGYILTKASLLKPDKLACSWSNGEKLTAKLVGTDHAFDLAMLKVDAQDLDAVVWSESKPTPGSWLLVPDSRGRVKSLGILSVEARAIPKIRAVMGVELATGQTQIAHVFDRGGAKEAGIENGDIIVHIANKDVSSLDEIKMALENYRAGDEVTAVIDRDGKRIEVEIMLGAAEDVFFGVRHWGLSGALNRRRDGFPAAIQFDAVLRPSQCGGPLVDVSGNVVGVTLARADRVSTFGATYQDLKSTIDELLSTTKAPIEGPVANKK